MKKLSILVAVFISSFFIKIGDANAYFRINDYKMNCTLNEKGDMYITETITYDTDEYRNGIYRDIDIKNADNLTNSADSIDLYGVYVDNESYQLVNTGINGNTGVFEYTTNDMKSYRIKVYSPFNYQGKAVKYVYRLTNVAVKYNDTGELYWNFVGNRWQDEIKHLTIVITLPEISKENKVYVFGHGSDNGRFKKDGNVVTLTVSDIQPGQAIDARILFSKDTIDLSKKTVNSNVLNKYIDMEEKMYRYKNGVTGFLTDPVNIAILFSTFAIIYGVFIFTKYGRKRKAKEYDYYRDLPGGLEPDVIECIYKGKAKSKTMWITFLNLIRKGTFKVDRIDTAQEKKNYMITYVNKKQTNLKQYESDFVEWIQFYFDTDNLGNITVDLLTLKDKVKKDKKSYELFESYSKDIEKEVKKSFGEKEKVPSKMLMIPIASMILLIVIIAALIFSYGNGGLVFMTAIFLIITTTVYSAIFASTEFNLPIVSFLIVHFGAFQFANVMLLRESRLGIMYIPYILVFMVIQLINKLERCSSEQQEVINQIRGLRNFIKDFSILDKRDLEQITNWEQFLIIAVALDINKEIINKFYNYIEKNNYSDFSTSTFIYHSDLFITSGFSQTFDSIRTSSPSSGGGFSGSSGGFSGGGGSGGGGGGGGGGGSF